MRIWWQALLSTLVIAVPSIASAGEPAVTAGPEAALLFPVAAPDSDSSFLISPGEDGAVRASASGGGARLIVRGTALVVAADETRLDFPAGVRDPAVIVPIDGALRLLVGSGGARLELNGFVLDLSRAEVLLSRQGAAWAIHVVEVAEGGTASLHPPPAPSVVEAAAAEPGAQIPVPVYSPRLLASGTRLVLTAGAAPEPASPSACTALDAAGKTLLALSPLAAGNHLLPIQVEDPADFAASPGRSGIGGTEVEIEAVEVEVGCVEVCVD